MRTALALVVLVTAGAAAAQDAARGAALAEARGCGACHGAQVVPRTPTIAGQHADFTVLQLVLMREGLRRVPAMQAAVAGLTDAQIEDLAAHYAALPPVAGDAGPRDAARFAEGARLSAAMNCGTCHLPTYAGRANIPRIAGQREDFLAQTLREYRDNIRVGADTQMNGAMHGVTDAQIAALAHYLAQR